MEKLLLILLLTGVSFGQRNLDYEYFSQRQVQVPAWEYPVTIFLAYHVMAVPHELIHIGTNYLQGGTFNRYIWHPAFQAVDLTNIDKSKKAPRWNTVWTNLSAHIFTRLTVNLPRKIYKPTDDGFYYRFTAAYNLWSSTVSWSTIVMGLVGNYANTKEGIGDFDNIARALTDDRTKQRIILFSILGLVITDAVLNWDRLMKEAEIWMGYQSINNEPTKETAHNIYVSPFKVRFQIPF